MEFFKSNGKLIFKTFMFQIVISLLGTMLGTATGSWSALRLVGTVFAVLVYFYIIGSQFWNKGSNDFIKKTERYNPLFGFLGGFFAFVPALVSILICCFLPMVDFDGNTTWVFALFAVVKLLFMGVFFGFAATLYPTGINSTEAQIVAANASQSFFFLWMIIPSVLVCGLCYVMGAKNINPFGMFTQDQQKDKK
jgi:hypothetical protein